MILHLALLALAAQAPDSGFRARIDQWRSARESAIVGELTELLSVPNLASDSVNIRRNAALIIRLLEKRGARAELLEAPGSPPAVYGELTVPGATRTVIFYAHYDGQPVDPSRWVSPPWQVTLRDGPKVLAMPAAGQRFDPEWRLFARSASDDKSPIIAMLTAFDALKDLGLRRSVNLKFFFEGEEEAGSRSYPRHAEPPQGPAHRRPLLFGDGPVHQSRRPVICLRGARRHGCRISPSMARCGRCTAGITATGCQIPRADRRTACVHCGRPTATS